MAPGEPVFHGMKLSVIVAPEGSNSPNSSDKTRTCDPGLMKRRQPQAEKPGIYVNFSR